MKEVDICLGHPGMAKKTKPKTFFKLFHCPPPFNKGLSTLSEDKTTAYQEEKRTAINSRSSRAQVHTALHVKTST